MEPLRKGDRFRRVWVDGLGRSLTRHELRQLRAAWDSIPPVRCKGLCWRACKNVPLLPVEAFFLIEKHGAVVEPGHHPARLAAGRSVIPHDTFVTPTLGAGKTCQYLVNERCSIYEDRPHVCRAYGHPFATLSCKYDCIVKNKLDVFRFTRIVLRIARILNLNVPAVVTTEQDFRKGLDALYEQWEHMKLIAEVMEPGDEAEVKPE